MAMKTEYVVVAEQAYPLGSLFSPYTEAERACQKWGGSTFMKLGVIYSYIHPF